MSGQPDSQWRTSSHSDGIQCVAVQRFNPKYIAVRHSSQDQGVLFFSDGEWDAFLKGVKAGEFDDLS